MPTGPVVVLAALIVGVLGVFGLYYGMDWLINKLPDKFRSKVRPFAFVGPAVVVLAVFLLYPTINTVYISFFDNTSEAFVGFENYVGIFTESDTLLAIRNSILWVIVVPLFSVVIGLGFAVLSDRLGSKSRGVLQDLHLHADGDLFRRRIDRVAVHLQLPARRVR